MSEQPEPADVPVWDVADRMRKALRESRISVESMADYLDVSRRSVGNWINGRIQPSTQTLRLWAIRTGVPYAWLAGENGDRPTRHRRPVGFKTRYNLRYVVRLAAA